MGKKLLLESAMIAAFLITLMAGSFNFAFASYPGPDTDSQYCGSYNPDLEYVYIIGYYEYGESDYYESGYWYSSRCSIDPFYRTGNLYVHYWTNQENNPYFSPVPGDTEFMVTPQPGYFEEVNDIYGQTGSYYYVTFPQFFWVQTYTANCHTW